MFSAAGKAVNKEHQWQFFDFQPSRLKLGGAHTPASTTTSRRARTGAPHDKISDCDDSSAGRSHRVGHAGPRDRRDHSVGRGVIDLDFAVGTINRGGIIGATWELDDRVTAYDVRHIESMGLDAGKTLLRIDHSDPGVARTIETVARISTELADRGIMSLIEPLPYVTGPNGMPSLDTSDDALVKVVAIASGLGASSAYTWLKIPASARMSEVAGATSLPILMLGGEPGPDPDALFAQWGKAMSEPNVRGLVAGRALLYPTVGQPQDAVRRASAVVRPTSHPTKGAQ